MEIDVITLFPDMFRGPFDESIVSRTRERGLVVIRLVQLRDFGLGRHRVVDDTPYGGGPGMVMRPEPLVAAIESVRRPDSHVVLLSPQGALFRQHVATELATLPHFILVCGRYEGVDERVLTLVDRELSIGDYVLSGGELPTMVIIEALVRLLPGALGDEQSAAQESHGESGLLDWPHYTRPREFRGVPVPEILLSGDHGRIAAWRHQQSLERTRARRPDLLARQPSSEPEHGLGLSRAEKLSEGAGGF